jgi:hypothetical protein
MLERYQTSAARGTGQLNPARSCRAKRSMRTVRGPSKRSAEGQTSMVVHDVAGPIVTGVLGGD